jgi:hypothetical protein
VFGVAVALVLLVSLMLVPSSAPMSTLWNPDEPSAGSQPPQRFGEQGLVPPAATLLPQPVSVPPPAPHGEPLPFSTPLAVEIPRIRARSSLVPLGLNTEGTVQVPPVEQPTQAGWYRFGPTPGQRGAAVILGHVDGNKRPGIFYRLRELRPGDEVFVTRLDGINARFVVERREQPRKDHFPTNSVYGDTDRAELRLITCGGPFDRSTHSYRDNIIVFAALA